MEERPEWEFNKHLCGVEIISLRFHLMDAGMTAALLCRLTCLSLLFKTQVEGCLIALLDRYLLFCTGPIISLIKAVKYEEA